MAPIKIGFGNLSDQISFSKIVRDSLEQAADRHGGVELLLRDNNLDNDKALANYTDFVETPVDVIIMYHIDERFNKILGMKKLQHNIPTIAVDIPIPLANFLGVNSEQVGTLAGHALGKWIQEYWNGHIDKVMLLSESRLIDDVRMRLTKATDVLHQYCDFSDTDMFFVDGGNVRDIAAENSKRVFSRWEHLDHIAVLGVNDDMVFGALDTANDLGMGDKVVCVGQGADHIQQARENERYARFIASVAYFPEKYGEQLIDMAVGLHEQLPVDRKVFVETAVLYR